MLLRSTPRSSQSARFNAKGVVRNRFAVWAAFIIAGMFEFQVEMGVKTAIESLRKLAKRNRPGRG